MDKPFTRDVSHWIGIDPGLDGAIGVLDNQGMMECLWDMPTTKRLFGTRRRIVNLEELGGIFHSLSAYPAPVICCEWPTTRPDESPESAKNFGIGLGQLETLAMTSRISLEKIPPNRWKQELGLPGKDKSTNAKKQACGFCVDFIQVSPVYLFGPRGGPLDGRAEAIAIAWASWRKTYHGMKVLADRFPPGSAQRDALLLMKSSRGRGPVKRGTWI